MDQLNTELARLEALREIGILDTPPEKEYDNLTQLASELFDVPIVLVSLIDVNRQWFKSNVGLDGVEETPRDVAFCHYAIQQNQVMVVEDALEDPRFSENPLVTGEPNIRFYAGAPLLTRHGFALGTLCLIDRVPRKLTEKDVKLLSGLANAVRDLLEKNSLAREVMDLADSVKKEIEISQSILNASEAAILRLEAIRNEQGKIIDFEMLAVNAAFLKVTQKTVDEIVGNSFLDHFPHVVETGIFERHIQVVETGETDVYEFGYQADGVDGWFRQYGEKCGEDGLTVSSTVITDRKKFELTVKALKEISPLASSDLSKYLEELLELGLKTFGAANGFVSNIQGQNYLIKAFVGELEGVRAGIVLDLKDTVCNIVAKEHTSHVFDNLLAEDVVAHPAVPKCDFKSYLGAPIFVYGNFYGSISFVRDTVRENNSSNIDLEILEIIASSIGHAIEVQNALQNYTRLNEELRLVLDNVPARIWYKDDQNKILRANKAAVESAGLTDPKEVEGVPTEELFPDMAEKYYQDDQVVLESGKPRRNIIESYAPSKGVEGWISTDKIPMVGEDGKKTILAVANDITALKTKEEQLSRLNESLSDFAFVASHDLQAPLRQSAMFAELLVDELNEHDMELPETAAEYLTEIEDGLRKMRTMVRSLYDLFKLDSQKITKKDIYLGEVVEQAEKQSSQELQAVNGVIEKEKFFNYPVNSALMVQVLQNLIVNACKYSESDNLCIRIYSETDVPRRQKKIIVEDNGVGVPAEFQKKIFEPFKRLHHSNDVEGAGIGLALCKKILAMHDGDLYLDSDHVDGARFVMAFSY